MRDVLRERARRAPDAPAVDAESGTLTWRELDARVDVRARELAGLGAGAGSTVAATLGIDGRAVEIVHAVVREGAVLAPLHPGWTDAERREAVAALRPSLWLDGTGAVIAEGERGATAAGPDDLAVLWTSGTGGRRRGVRLTRTGLAAVTAGTRERLGLAEDDRWYACLSPAHVGGLALLLRAAEVGSSVVLRGGFEAASFNLLADQGRVTHASLVPTMLRRILDDRGVGPAPPGLRALLVGGAALPADLLAEALEAGFPVAPTYGLTETSSQVATAPPGLAARKPGTVGPPLAGVEVRISGEGEVLVRGPAVSPGVVGSPQPLTDPDGWLRTGDLGRLDDEGHLWITGRRSDRIVTGGVTVDPGEVEAVLRLAPDVEDAAVVGVLDREWGEVVAAAVVPAAGGGLDTGRLERLVRERLSAAKRPRRIVAVDSIPRNANGKVDRDRVRELAERGGGT